VFAAARKLRETKSPQAFIYRYYHPAKKEYIWLEEKVYPQFEKDGRCAANLGIYRDVTDRIQNEALINEAKTSLERVLNSIDEVVYHMDLTQPPGNRIRFVGNNIQRVFGITIDEFIGGKAAFIDHCHPEDLETIRDQAERMRNAKSAGTFVYRYFRRSDQQYIWVEERVIPSYNSAGEQTEIFGVARDVTEQINNRRKLQVSEERFRLLAQNADDIIYRYMFLPEPHYEFISDSCQRITGYSTEDYYSNPGLVYSMVHPDEISHMKAAVELMQNNSGKIFSHDAAPLIFRSIRKDGRLIWTETNNRPILDAAGKVIGIEGISRDITERKSAEQEVVNSRESYRSLVDEHPDGIVIAAMDGKIEFVNKSVLKITKIATESEIIGRSLIEFLTPEQQHRSEDRMKKVAGGEEVPFEIIQLINTRGEVLEMESRVMKYQYLGKPAFLVFLRDITAERKLHTEQMRLQLAEEANRKLQQEIRDRIKAERELSAAQKNLRLLIDSSLDMICASDPEGYITEFNAAAQQAFGYSISEVIGKHVTMLYVVPDERNKVTRQLNEESGFFSGEVLNRRKDGSIFTAFLSASTLKDELGNVIGSMGVSRDISAIKNSETELRLNEEKYRAIYTQAYVGIALVDKENEKFEQVNQRLCDILGFTMEELQTKTIEDLRIKGDLSRLPSGKDFIRRGFERIFDEQRYRNAAGEEVIFNVTISLIKDENAQPLFFVYIYEDITPKRKAEEQIRIQAAKLNAVFESSSHMIWTMDREYKLTSFNNNQIKWLKEVYGLKPYIGMPMMSGAMISTEDYNSFWKSKADTALAGETLKFETLFESKKGIKYWREIYLNPIRNERDEVVEISCIAHDISDQKAAEENIKQSLKEKEVLLKEVHHRVKNNLQVISSILNLQSSYVKDKKSLDLLLESQNRIKSMAFVHESLYQTKDFSNIIFSSYVENITSNLVHSYSNPDNPPELNLDLDPIQLNLDTAIPCGLIINELISNALKYAFRDKKGGKLDVSVKMTGNSIRIVIADNGKGFPPDVDFRNTESLGLQLVVTLVDQISGKIELETKKGAKFTIDFIPPGSHN
jgi:PAS domain S-box-containing protein